jgi:hypothetical protein
MPATFPVDADGTADCPASSRAMRSVKTAKMVKDLMSNPALPRAAQAAKAIPPSLKIEVWFMVKNQIAGDEETDGNGRETTYPERSPVCLFNEAAISESTQSKIKSITTKLTLMRCGFI